MLNKWAIERLRSIPSEMQVVKMLYDRGCVLNEAPMVSEIRDAFQRSHIDIVAYPPEQVPGFLLTFKVDAKSHEEQYTNIFLETQTRINKKTGTRYPSWAFSAYQEGERDMIKKNRYLADVMDECNGRSFRKTIMENDLIDVNRSEKENAERIISFFSEHIELLDHSIIIYSFEDINDYLKKTGGIKLANRQKDRESKKTGVKYIICEWEEWDSQYGRSIYSWDTNENSWVVTRKGQEVHPVEKLPYWRSTDVDGRELSEKDNEYGMRDFISLWMYLQQEGLTVERFRRILGYYEYAYLQAQKEKVVASRQI